jgi:hypothetical protein
MLNAPTEQELAALPRLYSTKSTPVEDKIVHMRFFLVGFNWYAVEYDGQDTFMGFVVVHGNANSAELGYFSLSELRGISLKGLEVDCDIHWKPIPAKNLGIATNSIVIA